LCFDAHFGFFILFKAQLEIKESLISFGQTITENEATELINEYITEKSLMMPIFDLLALPVFKLESSSV
jgi:hypothetical protein|tara:strand:+ start:164 stop:370 length:207 start_codon:yes stop_codon:yes gene_type:complete